MPAIIREVLTRAAVEKAQARESNYRLWDAQVTGLCLRVYPSGVKTWEVHHARGVTERLGRFPALTLDAARSRAKTKQGSFEQTGAISKRDAPDSLKQFLAGRYGEWSKAFHKRGEANIKAIENTFRDFLKLRLADVTVSRAERWAAGRIADGISPATITDGDAAAIGAAVSTGNQPILNAITNLPSRNLRMPASVR